MATLLQQFSDSASGDTCPIESYKPSPAEQLHEKLRADPIVHFLFATLLLCGGRLYRFELPPLLQEICDIYQSPTDEDFHSDYKIRLDQDYCKEHLEFLPDTIVLRREGYQIASAHLQAASRCNEISEAIADACYHGKPFYYLSAFRRVEICAHALSETNPTRCGQLIRREIENNSAEHFLSANTLGVIAGIFRNIPVFTLKNEGLVETGLYIMRKLRENCFFKDASSLGVHLWDAAGNLDSDRRWEFAYMVILSLRESGNLRDFINSSGISVLKYPELLAGDSYRKVASLMLEASCCEHLSDYGGIKRCFDKAEEVYDSAQRSQQTEQMYVEIVRHKGLLRFHGDLVNEYSRAVEVLNKRGSSINLMISRASLVNHRGLGYFHTGQHHKAIEDFSDVLHLLKEFGIRLETPLNNIGAAYFLLGEYEEAANYFRQARDIPENPKYQMLSIEINFALSVFKRGDWGWAKTVYQNILDHPEDVPDAAIVAKANQNIGYILFCEGDFVGAARHFGRANEDVPRFQAEEIAEVRRKLQRLAAAKAGMVPGEDLGDYTAIDLTEGFRLPVWRPYQVDTNSLYVI